MSNQEFRNEVLARQFDSFLCADRVVVTEFELLEGEPAYSVNSGNQVLSIEVNEAKLVYRYHTKENRCRDRSTVIQKLGGVYHGPITFER